jgi:hypothetical protein
MCKRSTTKSQNLQKSGVMAGRNDQVVDFDNGEISPESKDEAV